MRERDHNESVFGLFQAEHRFFVDYLQQMLANRDPADVYAGLRQMANVLRIIMGREREQAQPNEAVLRMAGAMKAALAGERDDLDPRDSAGIEMVISRYGPLARRLYGQDENDYAHREQRRTDFDQVHASLALEGLVMSADDLAMQALLIRGEVTHDEVVRCYSILHAMRSKSDWPPEVAGVLHLLESQQLEAAMLVGCFLADELDDAGREELYSHVQAWFVRQGSVR